MYPRIPRTCLSQGLKNSVTTFGEALNQDLGEHQQAYQQMKKMHVYVLWSPNTGMSGSHRRAIGAESTWLQSCQAKKTQHYQLEDTYLGYI